jgi:pilus assembly protein TadC
VSELPAACDLLGVCLGAGMPPAGALAAVGAAIPAPLGPVLHDVAALYRLGAAPRTAWADVPGDLAALGRVLVRAGESGSAIVPALTSLAADARAAARARTDAAVRRAGIWVLAPLGLCFLPAFLCLGVVPLVLGISGDVFG